MFNVISNNFTIIFQLKCDNFFSQKVAKGVSPFPFHRFLDCVSTTKTMPKRRRIILLTNNQHKCQEMLRSLEKYDVEIEQRNPSDFSKPSSKLSLLLEKGSNYWIKGVVREEMRLFASPNGGMAEFQETYLNTTNPPSQPIGYPLSKNLHDGLAVIATSRLVVYQLPLSERRRLREMKEHETKMSLHTGIRQSSTSSSVSNNDNNDNNEEQNQAQKILGYDDEAAITTYLNSHKTVYEHSAEGFLDFSRHQCNQSSSTTNNNTSKKPVFGWDNIFVNIATNQTYNEMLTKGGTWWGKCSPRDINTSNYVMEAFHYKKRKAHRFLHNNLSAHDETISFDEKDSVGFFLKQQEHMNNTFATSSGLVDVFYTVANQGAFFRAAKTRRSATYWLPGLNAGIPFVAKKDPIHEITFMAHDFGHFLVPDLIYTGSLSPLIRKTYILYRMMSEATTLVFADMLFVSTLQKSNKYEYNWAKRKIFPLFVATGLDPFGTNKTKEEFFAAFKLLLQANVDYCLLGDDSTYMELIQKAGIVELQQEIDSNGKKKMTCDALRKFKDKYMPFFVEDYKWTSANFEGMRDHASDYEAWWEICCPLAKAAGILVHNKNGNIGLETVEEHLEAIGVHSTATIQTKDLIQLIFARVFNTRIKPIFDRQNRVTLASASKRRTQSFTRYLLGQSVIFSRYSFVPESKLYIDLVVGRTIRALQSGNGELSMEHVQNVRSCFAQFVRLLRTKSLITDDDVINYINVCPLFKATYVFYDENKSFYQSLNEVQAKILNDDDVGKDMKNTNGRKRWMTMIVGLSLMGVGFFT